MLWAYYFSLLRQRWQAGSVLLDLGKSTKQKLRLIFAICFLVVIFPVCIKALKVFDKIDIEDGLSVLLAVSFLLLEFTHNTIREHGIICAERFIKWEHIKSYEWEGENYLTLKLSIKHRFSPFRNLSLTIPIHQKDIMKNLLAQYLKGDELQKP